MPSSFVDSFPAIVKAIVDFEPRRVVDVGPGWGKYGLACREYVASLESLHAIEVRQGRKDVQDVIYDYVYTSDVRTQTSTSFWSRWDLVLIIDVIEHMTKNEGHALLTRIRRAGTHILISTPKLFEKQSVDDNPFEEHLSLWAWEDFMAHNIRRDLSTIDSVIYLLAP